MGLLRTTQCHYHLRIGWLQAIRCHVDFLLEKLQAEIESDGKAEAESYDKYASHASDFGGEAVGHARG